MTAPNRNALWGAAIVDELAKAGVSAVCVAPGSRSTPLTYAVADHPDLQVHSHLDERSAAFFALGRARRTGEPTPLICTSGTAAANFHPAVIEADAGRVPLLVLSADRPPALWDSGANQTIDQRDLYGDAVRWQRTLPEPAAEPRKLRSLRVTVGRAISETTGMPPGPVHLNVPFRKPLEPREVPGDVPADLAAEPPDAVEGRKGPFVETTAGTSALDATTLGGIAAVVDAADRGLIICGPADDASPGPEALATLAEATGVPVLADPLSGHRFGSHVPDLPVCGGYDSYLQGVDWPDPDVVVRFGASPTSKALRHYLRDADCRQFLVDPAGEWREAEFTATDLVAADPTRLAVDLAERVESPGVKSWRDRFVRAEGRYWDLVDDAAAEEWFEGGLLGEVATRCPDPTTLVVSNSMPVRDLDRFGRPRASDLTAIGNRGASGIDGVTSTALGAGSATDDPLVLVTGDLAYYHDMNGLLALERCGVDATIVLVNNDGGGIFHKLPIEEFDPPFTQHWKTPHGLDFEPTGDLYDFEFVRTTDRESFVDAFEGSIGRDGTQVVEATFDSAASHRYRETVHDRVCDAVAGED
ncbi:2-succinyl-5-enolpyruvyl-6-hydroxy-3-cyclohexene-1-carboxylic-acid synthase [Halobacteriales archaeon Cl-PHB]